MLVLTVIQGPEKGRRFELPDNEPQMIGRSAESLPLADQTISRRHASLTPDDGKWYIHDLQSSNGTYVNGKRLQDRRELKKGDQIRTGQTLMVFGTDGSQVNTSPRMRLAEKGEIDVTFEHAIPSSDDSMIMAVPDPNQAAAFQLRVIYELTGIIGSIADREELFDKVLNLVFECFQADRGFVLLCDSPDGPITPVAVRHRLDDEQAKKDKKQASISRTIVRYVLNKRAGVLTSNAMNDQRFSGGDSVQNLSIHSAMCVPIRFKQRMYGVIHIDSKIANYTYTDDQLTLLTAIGVQTGLAMANLNQYEARLKNERLAVVGQTVASLSHSIKNIVQGLRGGAEVVELGLRKENMGVIKSGWEIVARNLDRVSELAMNMLVYSKDRQPELEMTRIEPLIEELTQLTQKQFDSKQVALIFDIEQDLPPVPIDAGGIHQAVLNLLSNALDAVEPEAGVVTLRCHLETDDDELQISVTDNGEGMDEDTRLRLFQPFHSTKGLKGTGLGLVVTQKIIEEHGGHVEVDSTLGDGTTFTLHLPLSVSTGAHSADTHGPQAESHQPNQDTQTSYRQNGSQNGS